MGIYTKIADDGGKWVEIGAGGGLGAAVINDASSNYNNKDSGVVIDGKTYDIYTFTDDTATDLSLDVATAGMATILVVGGGGGAGNDGPGGGGGAVPLFVELPVGNLTVGVGSGGLSGREIGGGSSTTRGDDGTPSWLWRIAAAPGAGGAAATGSAGRSRATGGGGGRGALGGKAIYGEQGYDSWTSATDAGAGGAGGPGTGPSQSEGGPGYVWIDGNEYGAAGLSGGNSFEERVFPNTGTGGSAYQGRGSSGIVIVRVEI
jgi:hypothetical protein